MMGTSDIPELFLVSFLVLGISLFIGTLYTRTTQVKETFVTMDTTMNDITLQTCPAGTTSYIHNGITKCCNGDIVNNRCSGFDLCALSTSTDSSSCSDLLKESLGANGIKFCPASMPRYFVDKENPNRKRNQIPKKGCTSGQRKPDGKAPLDPKAKQCSIYPTHSENIENANSCYNIRLAENFKCPGTGKPATVFDLGNGNILHSCAFVAGISPVTCYTEISASNLLNQLKMPISDLNTRDLLSICSIADKYYLKKSINDNTFKIPIELTKIKNTLQNLIKQEEKKNAF